MKTLPRFVSKPTGPIVAALPCLDRVVFEGHRALAAPPNSDPPSISPRRGAVPTS